MRVFHGFIKSVTRLNDVLGRWISYLIFAIFAILLLGVFYRYALNAPTVWTTELTQFLFGAYAVMSGGYVMAHRGHVNVDLLHAVLPRRARAGADIFTSLMFFLFTGTLLYFGSLLAWESISSLETSYSAWNPPVYPFKAAIPVAAFLLLLQGLAKLFEDIAIVLDADPDDSRAEQDPS